MFRDSLYNILSTILHQFFVHIENKIEYGRSETCLGQIKRVFSMAGENM